MTSTDSATIRLRADRVCRLLLANWALVDAHGGSPDHVIRTISREAAEAIRDGAHAAGALPSVDRLVARLTHASARIAGRDGENLGRMAQQITGRILRDQPSDHAFRVR